MIINILLTVDLNDHVPYEARAKFYGILKQKGLIRRKLTTTWTATFKPGATKDSAVAYVQEAVILAAAASGVSDYEALVMPSDVAPTEWRKTAPPSHGLGLGLGGRATAGLLSDALRNYGLGKLGSK